MRTALIFISLLVTLQVADLQPSAAQCSGTFERNLVGLCLEIDNCTGAPIGGNCANGLKCCVPDPSPPLEISNEILTKTKFLKIIGNTPRNNVLYHYLVESMQKANVRTEFEIAAYLSQLMGETDNFRSMESSQLEADFDSSIGNNNAGDGINFRGRGGVLLRGRLNYYLANKSIPFNQLKHDIVEHPEVVVFPSVAFRVAAWFWQYNAYVIKDTGKAVKSSLNELADGTFLSYNQLTYALTNNVRSLKKRAKINEEILAEFGTTTMKRGQGVACQMADEKIGYAVPICLADFKKAYCGCEGSFEIQSCPYGRLADGMCRNSAMVKCCVEKCHTNLDLVILMDESGSITREDFKKEKKFVIDVINNLDIGVNKTRISVVRFSRFPEVVVRLGDTKSKEDLIKIVNKIEPRAGGTNTAGALKTTNEIVLELANGMRHRDLGIPKVVLTITDGKSDNEDDTKIQADKLKKREINLISVGVGKAKMSELLTLSSTPNFQYYVDDFDHIATIISDITVSSCKQPAEIQDETRIVSTVEKNSYKYFKYPLRPSNSSANGEMFLKKFTIELQEIEGSAELFFSFEDNNPKSDDDIVKETTSEDKEANFVEDSNVNRMKRNAGMHEENDAISKSVKTKFYQVDNPLGKEILFISVKGLEVNNSIEIQVYNRTVGEKTNSMNSVHYQNNLFFTFVTTIIFAHILSQ